ncbi:RH25 [Symbiodinium sp. CCMP2456]|nr:RH25 [Symbiodinium sp. CCMP2456]
MLRRLSSSLHALRQQLHQGKLGTHVGLVKLSSCDRPNVFAETTFADFPLDERLRRGLEAALGKSYVTPVQHEVLSRHLPDKEQSARQADLLLQAPTGTGKTIAFLLPALQRLLLLEDARRAGKAAPEGVLTLVVAPTRELVLQSAKVASRLLQFSGGQVRSSFVAGSFSLEEDINRLREDMPQLLFATPWRLARHLQTTPHFVSALQSVDLLVLDEADRLLDPSFVYKVDYLIRCLPTPRPRMVLCSATFSEPLRKFAIRSLRANLEVIRLGSKEPSPGQASTEVAEVAAPVQQVLVRYKAEEFLTTLHATLEREMGQEGQMRRVLVVFPTVRWLQFFYVLLKHRAHMSGLFALHRSLSDDRRRARALRFSKGAPASRGALFATDLASRGMDFDVHAVIQVGPPSDREQYVHRAGRTGRLASQGRSVLLLNPVELMVLKELGTFEEEQVQASACSHQALSSMHGWWEDASLSASGHLFFASAIAFYLNESQRLRARAVDVARLACVAHHYCSAEVVVIRFGAHIVAGRAGSLDSSLSPGQQQNFLGNTLDMTLHTKKANNEQESSTDKDLVGPSPVARALRALCRGMEGHPTWEYRLWTDDDAGEELRGHPGLAKAYEAADNPAEKSDILRLAIILRHGGLYVDVDFECLKPLDVLHSRASFYCGLSNVGAVEVNNGLFAATAGHPLVSYLCDHLGKPWPEWGQDDVDPKEAVAYQIQRSGMLEMPSLQAGGQAAFLATTGPGFFTRGLVKGLRLLRGQRDLGPMLVCPPEVFYPLPNTERGVPDAEFRMPSSLAVHHWFRTWSEAERTEAEENTAVLKRSGAFLQSEGRNDGLPWRRQADDVEGFLAFLNRSRQRYEEAIREAEAEKVEACASPFEWACEDEESSPTELPLPDSTEEASDRSDVAEALQDLPEDGCEAEGELRLPSADPSSQEAKEVSQDNAKATLEDPPENVQDGCEAEGELQLPSADPSPHEAEEVSQHNARATLEDPPENVQDSEIEVLGPALADPERFDEEDSVEADGDGGGVEPEDVKAHLAKRRKRLATQLFAVPGRRRRMLAESWPKDSHAVNAKVELHQGLKQEVPIKREAVKRELAAFPSDPSSADEPPGALLKRRRRGGAGAERSQADAVGDMTPGNAGRMMQGLPHADLLRLAGQLEHRYLGASEWQSVPVVV